MKHKLYKKATEVFIGLGNGKKLMFEFQRKHLVGGIAKKRYLHFTRRKKAIVASVGDNNWVNELSSIFSLQETRADISTEFTALLDRFARLLR